MVYIDVDALPDLERNAYQAGQDQLAAVAGLAIDEIAEAKRELQETEEARQELYKRLSFLMGWTDDAMRVLDRIADAAPDGRITKAQFAAVMAEVQSARDMLSDAWNAANS